MSAHLYERPPPGPGKPGYLRDFREARFVENLWFAPETTLRLRKLYL